MQSRKLKHKKKSWEYVLVQQVVQRDRCSLTGGAARKDGWGRTETERDDNQMLQLDGWNQAFISRRPNILPAPATTVARRRYQLQLAQSQVPLIDKVSLCIPSSWKITNNTGSYFCFVLLETCDGPNWIYYILVEFNRKRRGQTTPGWDLKVFCRPHDWLYVSSHSRQESTPQTRRTPGRQCRAGRRASRCLTCQSRRTSCLPRS